MSLERARMSEYSPSAWKGGEGAALRGEACNIKPLLNETSLLRDYIAGYFKVVSNQLEKKGLSDIASLGIHESIEHIMLQDENIDDFFGIEGFNIGIHFGKKQQIDEGISHTESQKRHYDDGYEVGISFAKINVLNGLFTAFKDGNEIDSVQKPVLISYIKRWLESIKPATQSKNTENSEDIVLRLDITSIPELVLNLSYYPRLAFAFAMNNGEKKLIDYKKILQGQANNSLKKDPEQAKKVLSGIDQAASLALKLRGDTGIEYKAQPEVIGKWTAFDQRMKRMERRKLNS